MVLIPDQTAKKVYDEEIAPHMTKGKALLFAHGFNVHFGQVRAAEGVDVLLVAPKGPGHLVRRQYQDGRGIPCLIAVHQDATGQAKEVGLAYAAGSAAPAPASSRRRSRRRPRPTCSASRRSSAAARPRS